MLVINKLGHCGYFKPKTKSLAPKGAEIRLVEVALLAQKGRGRFRGFCPIEKNVPPVNLFLMV